MYCDYGWLGLEIYRAMLCYGVAARRRVFCANLHTHTHAHNGCCLLQVHTHTFNYEKVLLRRATSLALSRFAL